MSLTDRAHPRYELDDVDAVVAGGVYPVENVSATGILINDWSDPPPEGTTGAFTLRTPADDGVMSMEITGTVVRVQPNGNVAFTYEMPDKSWPRLLEFLDKKQRGGER